MAGNNAQITQIQPKQNSSGFQVEGAGASSGKFSSHGMKMPQALQRVSCSGWFLKPLEFVEMAHHILIFFPSGDYIARQVQTWIKQYRASETSTIPAMERLIEWLPLHLPRQQWTTVVHGDFRSTWHEEGWYLDVESDGKGIWRGKKQLVFPQFTADNYPCTIISLCVAFKEGFVSFDTIDIWGLCHSKS